MSCLEQIWLREGTRTIYPRREQTEQCKSVMTIATYPLNCYLKDGISVDVSGHSHHFYGTVLVVLADTLAAHQLGGFKVGVGFSLRVCRDCMATKEMIQDKVGVLHSKEHDDKVCL